MSTLPSNALITMEHVTQAFTSGSETTTVLKDVSFTIHDNTFNIIYGASGSGKSTLLNIITGLQKPTTGSITYSGKEIYSLPQDELARFRSHRIGIVYQQNYWVHSLNVLENVALPLYFLGYARSLAMEMAMISLERVHMEAYARKTPSLLSGGEQQRVAMARALVNDPMIIIADEPTGNLDSTNGDNIMSLLSGAHLDSRRTIILVTHNMEYLPLADNLLHIQDGVVQELNHASITRTTNELVAAMKARIDDLARNKSKRMPHA